MNVDALTDAFRKNVNLGSKIDMDGITKQMLGMKVKDADSIDSIIQQFDHGLQVKASPSPKRKSLTPKVSLGSLEGKMKLMKVDEKSKSLKLDSLEKKLKGMKITSSSPSARVQIPKKRALESVGSLERMLKGMHVASSPDSKPIIHMRKKRAVGSVSSLEKMMNQMQIAEPLPTPVRKVAKPKRKQKARTDVPATPRVTRQTVKKLLPFNERTPDVSSDMDHDYKQYFRNVRNALRLYREHMLKIEELYDIVKKTKSIPKRGYEDVLQHVATIHQQLISVDAIIRAEPMLVEKMEIKKKHSKLEISRLMSYIIKHYTELQHLQDVVYVILHAHRHGGKPIHHHFGKPPTPQPRPKKPSNALKKLSVTSTIAGLYKDDISSTIAKNMVRHATNASRVVNAAAAASDAYNKARLSEN